MGKQRNQTIDLLKFIFSLCVIMIHAQLFKDMSHLAYATLTMGLARLAVPFFFISSGYYFYQNVCLNKDVKSYFVKIIKIFIIYELIEVLIYTVPMLPMIQKYGVFIYLWKIISVGLGGAYWYLVSLVLSLLILLPFWRRKSILPLLCIGLGIYLIVFTNDSYGFLFEKTIIQVLSKFHTTIWTWPQAGLCSSLFYLSLGAWIYEKKPSLHYINIYLLIAVIGLLCEAYFLQTHGAYDANCYLSLIICTPLLLIWALKHEQLPISTEKLGKMSLYIYMLHPLILNIINFALLLSYESLFVIVSIITITLSYLIVKKGSKEKKI